VRDTSTQKDFITAGPDPHPEYNTHGFRCKEFADIDMDNYILFSGSSHTEGVGVNPDQTFGHIVSAAMKCDQVNLGVGGGGIDTVEHNLFMWFLKYDKHPKAIVVEWPDYSRYIRDIYGQTNLCPAGMWSDSEFITYATDALYIKGEMVYRQLHKILPVPIIDVMYYKMTNNFYVDSHVIWHSEVDKGTDNSHAGPKTHFNTAENIHNALIR